MAVDTVFLGSVFEFILALSYVVIAATVGWFALKRGDLTHKAWRFIWLFTAFALASALMHAMSALNMHWPDDVASTRVFIRGLTALLAAASALAVWPLLPEMLALPSPGMLERSNRRMREEIEGHTATLQELEDERRSLEDRVTDRTRALRETTERFRAVLRSADIVVFNQDRDLRYLWMSEPPSGRTPDDYIGKTDEEILPEPALSRVVRLKRDVLENGESRRAEIAVARPGQPARWYDLTVDPAYDDDGQVIGITAAAVEITDRKTWENRQRLLMRELNHRSKNLLAVIQAVARQTAAHVGAMDDFLERFGARLDALARSHDLLVAESWRGVSLNGLVRSQLGHQAQDESTQVVLDGEDIVLAPEAAQTLGLALHELATNAAKYGALSTPEGRVAIRWGTDGDRFVLNWEESGAPPVKAPKHRGFGSVVVERNVARTLDAEVSLAFAKTGLTCRITAPLSNIVPSGDDGEND